MQKQIGMKEHFSYGYTFLSDCDDNGAVADCYLLEGATVQNPSGWSLVHLLVLEFAAMVAMRAGCQFIQVMLRTSLYSKRLTFVHYSFSLAGGQVITVVMGLTLYHGIGTCSALLSRIQ